MTTWEEHITLDADILAGKPIVKGTRLAVDFVVDLLAEGWTVDDIIDNYPDLTKQDIQACLAYAGEALRREKVFILPAG